MVNKKGWVRLIEAMIAILIIFGVVLVVSFRSRVAIENDLTPLIRPVLEQIADNATLREMVLAGNNTGIDDFVKTKINGATDSKVMICEISDICGLSPLPSTLKGDLFSLERVISATPDKANYSPKKIKIFVWRNSQ